MLDRFGGDHPAVIQSAAERRPIDCYHVDARLSRGMTDIGRARLGKVLLAAKYSFEAIWCRLRYGVRNFYYVPAPGQRVPLYRDWIVMAICRPFFRKIIFHTHAVGLGFWLAEKARPWERYLSRRLLGRADLNIVLSDYYRADVLKLAPRRVEVIPIGIPDGCPDFDKQVLPRRLARITARRRLLNGQQPTTLEQDGAGETPQIFRVLYVALCFREKGLFDALEAVAQFYRKLRAEKSPVHVR